MRYKIEAICPLCGKKYIAETEYPVTMSCTPRIYHPDCKSIVYNRMRRGADYIDTYKLPYNNIKGL